MATKIVTFSEKTIPCPGALRLSHPFLSGLMTQDTTVGLTNQKEELWEW